jgi:hypothetical protein
MKVGMGIGRWLFICVVVGRWVPLACVCVRDQTNLDYLVTVSFLDRCYLRLSSMLTCFFCPVIVLNVPSPVVGPMRTSMNIWIIHVIIIILLSSNPLYTPYPLLIIQYYRTRRLTRSRTQSLKAAPASWPRLAERLRSRPDTIETSASASRPLRPL